ncbi:glycoside hydrolase family 3 C-terminal domain-containing protein [Nocardioides sp. B-3]|nr:glycoside hydrolase family 3 C-terminal domain-containing protein [Nocardioides sp. B-3]UUZ58586.1 glycoside hydrolase family 3 C-terminal domain-containing protein [Nocardioides sp. B-3]
MAVIGPEADLNKTGGGSSDVTPLREVTPLEGLRERLGADRVVYDDGSDASRAAEVARAADVAVIVVGDKMTEGVDKTEPTLNAAQTDGIDRDALISTVAAAQRRTVVVLQTGGPVLTPWRDEVPAVLEAWYPGQNAGTALARVLFGDVEPGGRLPMTFPRSAADLPTAGDREAYPGVAGTVQYKEGVLVGYRHFDARGIEPAFEFGHGLGYTHGATPSRSCTARPRTDSSPLDSPSRTPGGAPARQCHSCTSACPPRTGRRPTTPPAQGLHQGASRPRGISHRHLPSGPPRPLLLGHRRRRVADGRWLLPPATGDVVAIHHRHHARELAHCMRS